MIDIIQNQFDLELRSVACEVDTQLNIHEGSVAFIPKGIFTAINSYSIFKDSGRIKKSTSNIVSISLQTDWGTLNHYKNCRLLLTSYKKNPLVYYAGVAGRRFKFNYSKDCLSDFLPKTVNLIGSIKGAINYTDRTIYHYGKNPKQPHEELVIALDMLNHFFHVAINNDPMQYFNHIYNKTRFRNFSESPNENIERMIYGKLPDCDFFIAIASKNKFLIISSNDGVGFYDKFFDIKPNLLNCSIKIHDIDSTFSLCGEEFPACTEGIDVLQMYLGDNKLVDVDLKEIVDKINYDRKEQERLERI